MRIVLIFWFCHPLFEHAYAFDRNSMCYRECINKLPRCLNMPVPLIEKQCVIIGNALIHFPICPLMPKCYKNAYFDDIMVWSCMKQYIEFLAFLIMQPVFRVFEYNGRHTINERFLLIFREK